MWFCNRMVHFQFYSISNINGYCYSIGSHSPYTHLLLLFWFWFCLFFLFGSYSARIQPHTSDNFDSRILLSIDLLIATKHKNATDKSCDGERPGLREWHWAGPQKMARNDGSMDQWAPVNALNALNGLNAISPSHSNVTVHRHRNDGERNHQWARNQCFVLFRRTTNQPHTQPNERKKNR